MRFQLYCTCRPHLVIFLLGLKGSKDAHILFPHPPGGPSPKGWSTGVTSHITLDPIVSTAPRQCVLYVLTALVRSRKAQSQDPSGSNVVQAQPLFPPPPPGHQTAPSVCSLTFRKDAAPNHILRDRLPSHIDVVLDCVHTTLLQHHL